MGVWRTAAGWNLEQPARGAVAPPRTLHSSPSEPQVPCWLEARAVARGVNTSSGATGVGLSAVVPIVVVFAVMALPLLLLLLLAAGTRRSGGGRRWAGGIALVKSACGKAGCADAP